MCSVNILIKYKEAVMRQKKLKLCVILLFAIGLTGLQAQEVTTSSGGNASGSGGSASYSVGQMVYTTHTGTNGSVAQGVQQPYEISVIIAIEEAKDITLQCSAYPNPTTDNLTLVVKGIDFSTLCVQLYDMNGKLLQHEKISGTQTSVVMNKLVPSSYFVKVIQGNKEIKTFKIIKN